MHADRAVLIQNDPTAVERLHGSQVVESNSTIVFRFDDWLLERLAGRTTDMECPHRQLRSRFADGLRRNDTDCFTKFDELPCSQIASVAHCAHPAAAFARKHRADL